MWYKKYAQLTILTLLLGSAGLTYQHYLIESNKSALTLAILLFLAAGIIGLFIRYKERTQPRGFHSDADDVIRDSGYLLQQGNLYWTPTNRVIYEASKAEALIREKRRKKTSY
ncbi:MAG: hypothetical protein ACTSPB_04850 [Candidatus Thorarchaeota archaeon]